MCLHYWISSVGLNNDALECKELIDIFKYRISVRQLISVRHYFDDINLLTSDKLLLTKQKDLMKTV